MSLVPTPRPWALGWLADRAYFIELGHQLNLCKGPAAEDKIELEAAAIHHVTSKTWWPYLVECIVNGSSEHVFAVYVDYKQRSYPPASIPRSELLPRKYCERLDAYMPLDDDPQWFTCRDGSYTPWRYGGPEPGPNTIWMDVSIYQPHPGAEFDHIDFIEEDEDEVDEYYEEEPASDAVEVNQEWLSDADSDCLEDYSIVEGNRVDEVYDSEDDDSATIHGEVEEGDSSVSLADASGDVSEILATVLGTVAL